MNTKDLARGVADQHGVTEKQAHGVLSGLLDGIADAVAASEEVSLPGFGKFKLKDMPERRGQNPATGEAITIAASRKVTFNAGRNSNCESLVCKILAV